MAKYVSLSSLSTLVDNIKNLFATKTEVDNAVAKKSQVQIITPESTEVLSTLQIHRLTQEEYDEKIASGEINESAIYLTPDEEIDLSEYATKEYVDSKEVPYEILENGNVVFENDVLVNKDISIQKTSTELGALKNSVGNLRDYWQYDESTTDVVTAINQNTTWALNNFEQHTNKTQDIAANSTSETMYPSVKAVYDLGQDIEETINTRTKLFHATLDPVTTHYIKDSGDFTYADVVATENCKIEATFGNVKIILNKEVHRNIEPDPIAGRYVEFSALLRNGLTTVKVFLFVYDPENLPTDPDSVAALENWGDSQYCGIAVQHIVIGDFLDNDITAGRNNTINAPSTKAVGDYTDSQCGAVLDYMQTTFADNIMTLCNQRFAPHIIYDDSTGFEASNNNTGDTWHLTGLDLSKYRRLKFYVSAGGDSDANYSPPHIVEMTLDDRAKGSFGYFFATSAAHCPNNRNRHHIVSFAVNAEKTAIQFQHAISLYGTAASNSAGGRRCYLIEGYLI